ncbi:MAG: PD40 domain-containing protein, partial [Dinghuibacter sp.]|nr:PD40 domain-containing protein [Dinghuibacter sp.]
MKKTALLFFLLCAFSRLHAQPVQPYFLSWPSLSPDASTIVFSFEGDLWKVPAAGGTALRITAMQGNETHARFSPDGQWIAFTGRQLGNPDIYIMPASGGEIRQLTWHSGSDNMESWSWDSRHIYFSSNRYNILAGYKLNIQGGTPTRVLGSHFFSFDHNLFEHPNTGEIFFNDTWESASQLQRKGYKGPFNPEIQSWNPKTSRYKKYTSYEGKDFAALFDQQGNMYYTSDEETGEYNLFSVKNDKKNRLTRFTTSIRNAQVNARGGTLVFEKDYGLWLYDVASGKTTQPAITLNRNDILPRDKDFDVRGSISAFDASPDGKKLAFIARGELFVSDKDGKFIKQVEKGSAERAVEIKWLADNKTLLFSQTVKGVLNWFTIAADGSAPVKQLTNDAANNRSISFNKNRTKAVYLSGRNEVRIMDLKTMASTTVAKDELWLYQS